MRFIGTWSIIVLFAGLDSHNLFDYVGKVVDINIIR